MKKNFKGGAKLADVEAFVEESIGSLDGASMFRVTIEPVRDLAVDEALMGLGLGDVIGDVYDFVEYRKTEIRKPIRSEKALIRILKKFEGKPAEAKASIVQTMAQGWTGLFEPKGGGASKDRTMKGWGGSSGGIW